jgi:hypothetical protein
MMTQPSEQTGVKHAWQQSYRKDQVNDTIWFVWFERSLLMDSPLRMYSGLLTIRDRLSPKRVTFFHCAAQPGLPGGWIRFLNGYTYSEVRS